MVSQADRELINNFVNELRPYLETIEAGVQEFAQPSRDGVAVGQAVQALMMVRGAGQILMVDGLVSISSWLVESLERIQNNPEIRPAEATRRLTGIYSAMEDFLDALDDNEDVDSIILRAKTIYEAIPAFGGPLPGTGNLRPRTNLDALFGDDINSAPTDKIGMSEAAADTEKLAAKHPVSPNDQTAEIPAALPTVPLQRSEAETQRVTDQPARIVPAPPQPTEKILAVDPELRAIFEEEALDIIAAFGDGIRELARDPSDTDAIRDLSRAAHTLRGAANMTGFSLIAQIGAAIETLFDAYLEHDLTVSRDVLELVAVSWKMLRAMLPKLTDLSSFTSPSNSIVQRANILRDEIARTAADAETTAMDLEKYREEAGTPVGDSANKATDEIIAVNIQMPAPPAGHIEVDAMMVEAAPTVPLNREPAAPLPVDESRASENHADDRPVVEFDTDPVTETDEDSSEATSVDEESVDIIDFAVEEVDDSGEGSPFWRSDNVDAEPESEGDERRQSEPFWTPGTEELMRSAVHTDQLIADLYNVPDFDEELAEEVQDPENEEFFAEIDDDESEIDDNPETDDATWLETPVTPATDLLNFDARPQTEPFWGSREDSSPDTLSTQQDVDEPVTMEPFFEPVEGGTTFLRAAGLDETFPDKTQPEAIDEALLEEDWFDDGIGDAAPSEASTAQLLTPGAEDSAPEQIPASEALPLDSTLPTDLVNIAELDDVEDWEPAGSNGDEHSYDYVFDFDMPLQPEDGYEQADTDQSFEPGATPLRLTGDIISPAFESDLAAIVASVELVAPQIWHAIAARRAEIGSASERPAYEAEHWSTLDEMVPTEAFQLGQGSEFLEFNGIDLAADDEFLAALDARLAAAAEDVIIEMADPVGEDWTSDGEAGTDDIVLVEAFEPLDSIAESEPAGIGPDDDTEAFELVLDPPATPVIADEEPDVSDGTLIDFDREAISDLDSVLEGLDTDDIDSPDWFDEPVAAEVEPQPDAANESQEPVDMEPEPDSHGTGLIRETGAANLGGRATDSLGFGALDLARFMTPEGSVALSSALLDMAFADQDAANGHHTDTGSPSISVFDESSDRALEIEMFETFAIEAEEHLAILNRAAMQIDRDPLASEPLVEIKRALHTIKGASAAADFSPVSSLAHYLEDELASHERLGTLEDRTFATKLFAAIEEIESRLAQRKDELFGKPDEEQETAAIRVDISRVDNLLNTVGELVVNRSSFEERLERLETMIEDLSTAATRLQRSSYMLEREANAEDAIGRLLRGEMGRADRGFIVSTHNEWDTMEMDRYTEFDRLIRQLAEVGADVSTVVGEISSLRGDFDTVSTRQRRLTTALQDELMGIRMVPISSLAPRLYRVVRRAAGQRGKEVSLVFEGGETPFDKILLDTLSESLLHLLRNAVDHGIEHVGERRRLGKPEHGTIRVRAFRDGSEAVIEIIDDGAGIDHTALVERAREQGIAVADGLSREDALALIFTSGFSTRSEADDISGRGLGLEIVEQTVTRYKGRVAVDSVPGKGTVFSLRLPVMLSVIQAFLIKAGDGDFAIPVANVDYVVDRIDQPLTQIGESVVVETAGQIIPVVDLAMKLGSSEIPVLEKDAGWIMVTEIAGKRWALVVDELFGQQEIVVKPMGRFLRTMPELMGATILGHGDVALIVDVPALLGVDALATRISQIAASGRTAPIGAIRTPSLNAGDDGNTRVVLIVDDSLSVRRVVSRTLERHGWHAVVARDGAEALEILEHSPVDAVLTDIEMPRMDGFELITTMRGREATSGIPIAVLTSRSGEKHRERALDLGADEYLVKPFEEQELVNIVEHICRVASRA